MEGISIIERIRGVRIATGADRLFLMDDPDRVYFVEQGYLNIFAVELSADEPVGRRRFVARVPTGEMAFGHDRVADPTRPEREFGFLAVPSLDTIVIEGERAGVASDSFDLAATTWIDDWIFRLSEFLVRGRPPPRHAALLEADPDVHYPPGSSLSAQHGDVIWVFTNVPMRLVGRADMVVTAGESLLPVTEQTWLEVDTEAEVSATYTPTAILTGRLWPAFLRFGRRVLEFAILAEAEAAEVLEARRRNTYEARRAFVSAALRGLGQVLGAPASGEFADSVGQTPLQVASRLVASSCGASLKIGGGFEADSSPVGVAGAIKMIEALAHKSGIRTRQITLAPGWWRRDGPSFVGFTAGEEKPLGVLSNSRGGYRVVDPETGTDFQVNGGTAAGIAPEGLVFYAPLPDDIDNTREALRFSLYRRGRDLCTIFIVGMLGGLAALLTPIFTGKILAEIIPRADISSWLAALGALLLVAFGSAVFEIVQGLTLLRIEGRFDERLQAAIWSRLISLPTRFFRVFTAGDLADRASGISRVRQLLTGAVAQVTISGIFSIFSLGLLFYYSWSLALSVCALLLALVGVTLLFSQRQLHHYREAVEAQGFINGFVFQLITGLAKLRVANAESYALAHWAKHFARQKRASLSALRWAAGLHAVSGIFRPLALIVIFALAYDALLRGGQQSSFGLADFLSFHAAFGQLTAAVIGLVAAAMTVIAALPLFERVQPVLDAQPETAGVGIDPGDLTGDIEFANVSFRYAPDVPNAIGSVSFRINQGDYVAFVGPSGCGKSTIYRLLLGFEQPDSGTVFLDGRDLSGLDPVAVRNCMGVVLQNGQLVAGNIYENIVGMSSLSVDEAWEAARAAALEEDIQAMPMGMRTLVLDGGVGLSAGQKQRLLIARALARKPRILLFDEATSALDNRAQAMIQESLKKLSVTRVVIAHRLSSIRDVDRIFVLDAGRIVESGRYDELIARSGVFASLVRRQLIQT